jgi:hypothetical protein
MILEILKNRISELSDELQSLVETKNNLHNKINDLSIMIHQKVGAIEELHKILIKEESNPSLEKRELEIDFDQQ